MGILFDADGEYISHGSGANLDDLSTFTVACWYYPTTIDTSYRVFLGKFSDAGADLGWYLAASDKWDGSVPQGLNVFRKYDTVAQSGFSSDNFFTLNAWNFVGVYFPGAGTNPSIYHGTLSKTVADDTEQPINAGSGGLTSDAALNLYAGGYTESQIARGTIGFYAIWNGQVSLNGLKAVQFNPLAAMQVGDCRLLSIPGLHGASTIVDLSGNNNTGSVTNATASSVHLPISINFGLAEEQSYIVSAVPTGFMTTNTGYWGSI